MQRPPVEDALEPDLLNVEKEEHRVSSGVPRHQLSLEVIDASVADATKTGYQRATPMIVNKVEAETHCKPNKMPRPKAEHHSCKTLVSSPVHKKHPRTVAQWWTALRKGIGAETGSDNGYNPHWPSNPKKPSSAEGLNTLRCRQHRLCLHLLSR
ncbi:hypothetical protein NDU88_000032 [Pleurodeles waltl]|uniref:Uncharacterized protein n=1 Tax=Pleurodeles waltl TaxID=8319 RepID=A0AAV7WG98_PLEWA|nr:hypothetical protein NDU88_000032 [Pleurodeles waltl]